MAFRQSAAAIAGGPIDGPPLEDRDFAKFSALIRQLTGIALSPPKRELLRTRLRKRLRVLGLQTYEQYYQLVSARSADRAEIEEFINCITTNKTDFLREPHHFDFLTNHVFPEIQRKAKATGNRRLRIWSAACSTGQEPYSIAMSVRDYFDALPDWDIRLLASDIDSQCLREAAAGEYAEPLIDCVPLQQKKRYFLRGTKSSAGLVTVRPRLKDLITFRQLNFADANWPIRTQFDVIFCRNAMIYFERDFQEQLLRKFMRYLSPDGYLILGHSENVAWMPELEPLGKTIYRVNHQKAHQKTSSTAQATHVTAPEAAPKAAPKTESLRPAAGTLPLPVNAPTAKPKPRKAKRSIVAGEVFATGDAMEITTLLGSCIAACLYDTKVKVGGMNHFLLPQGNGQGNDTACYGINAMELLINEIMQRGGDRSQMVARLYGGASVMSDQLQSSRVGEKNIDFVRKYLTTEGIPIVEQKVGGNKALRVAMQAATGDVVATELDHTATQDVSRSDASVSEVAAESVSNQPTDQITMF